MSSPSPEATEAPPTSSNSSSISPPRTSRVGRMRQALGGLLWPSRRDLDPMDFDEDDETSPLMATLDRITEKRQILLKKIKVGGKHGMAGGCVSMVARIISTSACWDRLRLLVNTPKYRSSVRS